MISVFFDTWVWTSSNFHPVLVQMVPHLHDQYAPDHLRIITTSQQSGEGNVSNRVCTQGWGNPM